MSHNYDYDALHARGKSMEDAYFAERDRELIEKLKRDLTTAESKRLHAVSLGISEEHVEREFAHLGPGIDVIPTMAILPLVEVAWCDGSVSAAEKAAVLKATAEIGIAKDSPFYQFLQTWLDARPSSAALELWKMYVKEFLATVTADTKAKIREGILGRAEKVAAAAGGILGYNTISTAEQKCLQELGKAFE
jgi:hypothetical protein